MIWFDYKFDWFDHLFDQICQSGPCLQEDSAKGLWVKASVWITSSSHVMLCDVLICYVYIMQCYLWFYYFAFSMLVNRCMTCYDFLYYIFDYYILLLPSFEIIIHIICIYIYILNFIYIVCWESRRHNMTCTRPYQVRTLFGAHEHQQITEGPPAAFILMTLEPLCSHKWCCFGCHYMVRPKHPQTS